MLLMRTLLVGLLVGWLASGRVASAEGAPIATATISLDRPGVVVSPTFMGFSHEWSTGQQLMGAPETGTNPKYRQLVQALLAYGGGPLNVRIGGNSTDKTGEPQANVTSAFAQLYTDIGAQFELGVNLGAGDVSLAQDQARAYVQGMPSGSLLAIEIGNEPDLFHNNGDRSSNYSVDDYIREFASWRSSIVTLLPTGVKLMGPAWSGLATLKSLPAFLDQERESQALAIVSQHWYAGTQCNGRTNPPDYLLRDSSATSAARGVAASVTLAHQRGLPFRMGEMNSISCGGEVGVSDVFASSLWAADSLFELANVGVDGVNFHTGNSDGYSLFSFNSDLSLRSVRPEYYGLLLFQQSTGFGSRLLPVSLTTSANVKVWATLDSTGSVRVLAINKDENAAGDVSLRLPDLGTGALVRLSAPSLDAKTGITLAGQTFDGSADGTLQGAATTEPVIAGSGAYTFHLPTVSAALLTLPPPQP